MTESAAEKRARLRRMKILVDSERRLNRIIDGNSQQIPNEIPSIDSNCDIDQQTNQSQDSGNLSNLVNCGNQINQQQQQQQQQRINHNSNQTIIKIHAIQDKAVLQIMFRHHVKLSHFLARSHFAIIQAIPFNVESSKHYK
ncbi:hypothetical protein BLOT_012605 [Blomia tropicalis]|nr:hypothetical protein BLOT_012605 [Blomia tropicalis]